MEKVNFNSIKEHVNTKYGDLTGVIQIDGHSNISSIYDLCRDKKIDTKDKFIVGFGFGEETTNGIGKSDSIHCSILYVNKDEYGDSFDDIKKKIISTGNLKIKKAYIYIKYSELGKYIKRFDFLATTELTNYASSIEIEDKDKEE